MHFQFFVFREMNNVWIIVSTFVKGFWWYLCWIPPFPQYEILIYLTPPHIDVTGVWSFFVCIRPRPLTNFPPTTFPSLSSLWVCIVSERCRNILILYIHRSRFRRLVKLIDTDAGFFFSRGIARFWVYELKFPVRWLNFQINVARSIFIFRDW